jgi:hypothetical protein
MGVCSVEASPLGVLSAASTGRHGEKVARVSGELAVDTRGGAQGKSFLPALEQRCQKREYGTPDVTSPS